MSFTDNAPVVPSKTVGGAFGAVALTTVVALGGALIGALLMTVPAILLDRRRYGDGNDDAGTLFYFLITAAGFIAFVLTAFFVARTLAKKWSLDLIDQALTALWLPAGYVAYLVVGPLAQQGGFGQAGLIAGVVVSTALLVALLLRAVPSVVASNAALVVAALAVAAGALIGPLGEERFHRSEFTRQGTPLAFVDESQLNETLPGWTVGEYGRTTQFHHRVTVEITTPTGFVVDLRLIASDLRCRPQFNTCVELDPLADGSPVVAVLDSECTDDAGGVQELIVTRPTGVWTIGRSQGRCDDSSGANPGGAPTISELELVLQTVEPVSVETWIETVGGR